MTMIKQQIFFLSSLQRISGSVLNVPFSSPLLVIFHFPARFLESKFNPVF